MVMTGKERSVPCDGVDALSSELVVLGVCSGSTTAKKDVLRMHGPGKGNLTLAIGHGDRSGPRGT